MIGSCSLSISVAGDRLGHSRSLRVEDLEILVSADAESHLAWLTAYLDPLVHLSSDANSPGYQIACLVDDALVQSTIVALRGDAKEESIAGNEERPMLRYPLPDAAAGAICIAPDEGMIWFSDLARRKIYVVAASRNRWPSLRFCRTVRDVIVRYLHSTGWSICHAGAVQYGGKVAMLLGDSGAGKTTLLTALMYGGAQYVSNELLFTKAVADGGIRVLSFPLPVAIGMGTALQFPESSKLLDDPYHLQYPPRRLNLRKLAETRPEDRVSLPDKFQVLPQELCELLSSPPPLGEGSLDLVIAPDIARRPLHPSVYRLTSDETDEILSRNMLSFNNLNYAAAWLPIDFPEGDGSKHELLRELIAGLPAVELRYHLAKNRLSECSEYLPMIYREGGISL